MSLPGSALCCLRSGASGTTSCVLAHRHVCPGVPSTLPVVACLALVTPVGLLPWFATLHGSSVAAGARWLWTEGRWGQCRCLAEAPWSPAGSGLFTLLSRLLSPPVSSGKGRLLWGGGKRRQMRSSHCSLVLAVHKCQQVALVPKTVCSLKQPAL